MELDNLGAATTLTPEQQAAVDATRAEMAANGGILETRTADEIEAEVLKKLETEQLERLSKLPPEELQAIYFKSQWPQFKYLIDGLSGAEARRLVANLVGWPIEVQHPYFSTERGKNSFLLGQQLLQSKQVMIDSVEIKRFNEQEELDKLGNLGDNTLSKEDIVSTFEHGDTEEKEQANG